MLKLYKKQIKILTFIAVVILYYLYIYYYISKNVPPNSDYANWIFKAKDILDGNILQSGWLMSDISYLLTDLPYFIIGVIIKGATIEAYNISVSLMHVCLVMSGLLLVKDTIKQYSIKLKITYTLIFIYICGFGNQFWIMATRAHSGGTVWAFIGLYFLNKYQITTNKKYIKYVFIFYALSCCGDTVALIAIIIPSIIVCLINLLNYRSKNLKIILIQVLSIITGKFVDKLYCCLIPKTILSRDSKGINFLNSNGYPCVIKRLFSATLHIYGAEVNSECSIINIFFAVFRLFVIILTISIIFTSLNKIKKREKINLTFYTAITGIIILYFVFLISNLFSTIYYSMYMNSIIILSAVIIIQHLQQENLYYRKIYKLTVNKPYIKFLYLFFNAFLFILCFSNIFFSPYCRFEINDVNKKMELMELLKKNHLHNGYATNWFITTNINLPNEENNPKITAIHYYNKNNVKNYYISLWRNAVKISNYNYESNFIVLDKKMPDDFWCTKFYNNIQENLFLKYFGYPKKVIENDDYKILVYDYNISKKIDKYDAYISYFSKYRYMAKGCDFDK